MSEPKELSYNEVIRFLNEQGGRSTNRELVCYFKKLLNDPVNQVANRLLFRDIVNAVGNVLEEQGVKYVCLKEKYLNLHAEENVKNSSNSNLSNDFLYNHTKFQSSTTGNKAQNYQPYWRYRLSCNAKLVPPPPLLSFRFPGQEESTSSLPTHLSSSYDGTTCSNFSDESFEGHQDKYRSLEDYPNSYPENDYSPLQREDPLQIESSWIHEHGHRTQRFYSEPKDVDFQHFVSKSYIDRPRHNSIAVGLAATSVLEDPDHESGFENEKFNDSFISSSDKTNQNLTEIYETRRHSNTDIHSSRKSSLPFENRDRHSDAVVHDPSNTMFSENHLQENKENICDLNENEKIVQEQTVDTDGENDNSEYRPHSESVKERARRIENMANEMASTTKTSLPVPNPLKSKLVKSEKVLDDNASVASQLDSKLRRQWFVKAAQSDYHAMVALLKKEPRLAGIRDITSGFTALHWAAKHGNAEVVKLIAGTHKVNPDVKSHGGYTCLHIATLYKHKSIVDLLIRTYGANPTIRDNNGKRADQYPPNYVSFTAGMNRRPADPRTSKPMSYLERKVPSRVSSFKSVLRKDKPGIGRSIGNVRRALRHKRKRSGSESDIFAKFDLWDGSTVKTL